MATNKDRVDFFQRFGSRLRYPYLFIIILILFLIDILTPDPIPLIDEAILGLLAVLFGTWKERKKSETSPTESVS
jgi:hypothetical protein